MLALKKDIAISFMVLRYEELNVGKIWEMIKDSPEITIYFPDFKSNKLPERDYLVSMTSTINPEPTKTIIAETRKKSSISISEHEGNLIKIMPELSEELRT